MYRGKYVLHLNLLPHINKEAIGDSLISTIKLAFRTKNKLFYAFNQKLKLLYKYDDLRINKCNRDNLHINIRLFVLLLIFLQRATLDYRNNWI